MRRRVKGTYTTLNSTTHILELQCCKYHWPVTTNKSQLLYRDLLVQMEMGRCAQQLVCLQAQMKALQIQVQENRGTVTRVELEEAELKKKLTSLEENLKNSVPVTIKVTKIQNCQCNEDR